MKELFIEAHEELIEEYIEAHPGTGAGYGGEEMRFQISQQGGGRYSVIDMQTRQVRYTGSLEGARQAQARLLAGGR